MDGMTGIRTCCTHVGGGLACNVRSTSVSPPLHSPPSHAVSPMRVRATFLHFRCIASVGEDVDDTFIPPRPVTPLNLLILFDFR